MDVIFIHSLVCRRMRSSVYKLIKGPYVIELCFYKTEKVSLCPLVIKDFKIVIVIKALLSLVFMSFL